MPDATIVRCEDNFRTPQRVVDAINLLNLTSSPIRARSPWPGKLPTFEVWSAHDEGGLRCVEKVVNQLFAQGVAATDIAFLSCRGQQKSALLQRDELAGQALRRFTGRFDAAGNALWTEGSLLAETVLRFKGQSAPVVVLCEVDFASLPISVATRDGS